MIEEILTIIKENMLLVTITTAVVFLLTTGMSCVRKDNDNSYEIKQNQIKLEQSKINLEMEKVKYGYKVTTTEGSSK